MTVTVVIGSFITAPRQAQRIRFLFNRALITPTAPTNITTAVMILIGMGYRFNRRKTPSVSSIAGYAQPELVCVQTDLLFEEREVLLGQIDSLLTDKFRLCNPSDQDVAMVQISQ